MKWTQITKTEKQKNLKIELPSQIVDNQIFEVSLGDKKIECRWDRWHGVLSVIDDDISKQYRVRASSVQKNAGGDYDVTLEYISPGKTVATNVGVVMGLDSPGREQRQKITGKSGFVLKSPMNGKVLEIAVKIGQKVETGQVLVVIEAMKMENTIIAEHEGTIESIQTEKNAVVTAGQVLIKAKSVSS